ELLTLCSAGIGGVTTVHGGRVVAAVFQTMIVLQAQTIVCASQNPGARMVVTNMKRHLQFTSRIFAAAHMQDQGATLEGIRFGGARLVGHDTSGERLATVLSQPGKELVRRSEAGRIGIQAGSVRTLIGR